MNADNSKSYQQAVVVVCCNSFNYRGYVVACFHTLGYVNRSNQNWKKIALCRDALPRRAPETFIFTGSIARSATRRYLIYSEADFEVCRPAGATRCTDGGETWPSSLPSFTPIGATVRV